MAIAISDTLVRGGVLKRSVGDLTFSAYMNSLEEQKDLGNFGGLRIFQGESLYEEFELKDEGTLDYIYEHIRSLNEALNNLEGLSSAVNDIQVFLLDTYNIGLERQNYLIRRGIH